MFTSAKDLIAKKTDIIKRLDDKLVVTVGDLGDWQFNVPTAEDVLDAKKYGETHNTAEDNGDSFLVYSMCVEPNLHDEVLQEAMGAHGASILYKILRSGEVDELARALMLKAGYYGANDIVIKGAEQVKNS